MATGYRMSLVTKIHQQWQTPSSVIHVLQNTNINSMHSMFILLIHSSSAVQEDKMLEIQLKTMTFNKHKPKNQNNLN